MKNQKFLKVTSFSGFCIKEIKVPNLLFNFDCLISKSIRREKALQHMYGHEDSGKAGPDRSAGDNRQTGGGGRWSRERNGRERRTSSGTKSSARRPERDLLPVIS